MECIPAYCHNSSFGSSAQEREAYFGQLKAKVSQFITTQLEAEPKLDPRHLRDQLLRILGKEGDKPSECSGTVKQWRAIRRILFVQRWPQSWGPKETGPVLWGVVYSDAHHVGLMGNRVIVESYVVNQGKANLAGRGGSELDGVAMHAERMNNPDLSVSHPALAVLVHGVVEWTSGHALPGRGALYAIDAAGVRKIWQDGEAGLQVFGHPDGDGFTVMYHDENRHQSSGGDVTLTSVIDVYVVGPKGPTRVVSHRY